MSVPKIDFVSKSKMMKSYAKGEINQIYTGGFQYGIDVITALESDFEVTANTCYVKSEQNILRYLFRNQKKKLKGDICISDPFIAAMGKLDEKKQNIVIFHHLDSEAYTVKLYNWVFEKALIRALKKVDHVVVVSQYWKKYLQDRGVISVSVIYNSYNLNFFSSNEAAVESLFERLGVDKTKPTIYLGKNSKGKGIEAVLENINCNEYNLIATGNSAPYDSRVICCRLNSEDYRNLLAGVDVVMAMSSMPEGWNRVAHEAMLFGTPVIGSGSGGMRELLEKGGQRVVKDISKLPQVLEEVMSNREALATAGRRFVQAFDNRYFQNEWHRVVSLVKELPRRSG